MTEQTETIDIYDASLRPLGSKDRIRAHLDADWHKTVHFWVLRMKQTPALLFQERSASVLTYPGKLDVSAAGHLSTGESVEDGVRELQEELGIVFRFEDLVFAGERVEVSDDPGGFRNREFQSVFFVPTDLQIEDFRPQHGEVSALIWLPIDQGILLFDRQINEVECEGIRMGPDRIELKSFRVKEYDFVPRVTRYYLASLLMADRLASGGLPLAVS